jgi:protein-S-isoprenylcysteine O-methyltransferase Ste14
MSRLELKIPPDVVWVTMALLMWLASRATPAILVPDRLRVGVAVSLIVAGTVLIVVSRMALDSAGTTWHPTEPQRSTRLLTTGVYRFSRNPTYVGMAIVLLSWAVMLASPVAGVLSTFFVAYVDRFQIRPEERILAGLFGQDFRDYTLRVRRWV